MILILLHLIENKIMKPISIKVNKGMLEITWSNNTSSVLKLTYLRDECPCAGCKGETILFRTFKAAPKSPPTEDTYKIKSITPVGDYAIQIAWKDGHDTGIYSWDYLKELQKGSSTSETQEYSKLI